MVQICISALLITSNYYTLADEFEGLPTEIDHLLRRSGVATARKVLAIGDGLSPYGHGFTAMGYNMMGIYIYSVDIIYIYIMLS